MRGHLDRLRIRAFKDEGFSIPVGGEFVVWMNPRTYARNFSINQNQRAVIGGKASDPVFESVGLETLNFDLLFDTTGLVPSPLGAEEMPSDGVVELIEPLIDLIARVPPNRNNPNFVQLSWAQLQVRALLSKMTVTYKLFRQDGTPIRAEVSLSFNAFTPSSQQPQSQKRNGSNIPEQDHVITFREGDTLPALCAHIYGNSDHYLAVAEYNHIYSFLTIRSGTRLTFPPLSAIT